MNEHRAACPATNICPYCSGALVVSEMACASCSVAIRATFPEVRLARLPVEHQRFIELFVLTGGSLKEVAKLTGVSYPTVRSRLDRVIEMLRGQIENTLSSAEPGDAAEMSAAETARIIKNI